MEDLLVDVFACVAICCTALFAFQIAKIVIHFRKLPPKK